MGLVLALVGQTVPAQGQTVPGQDRVALSRLAWAELRARTRMDWLAAVVLLQGAMRGEAAASTGPEEAARRALADPGQVATRAAEDWIELASWADHLRTRALGVLGQDQDRRAPGGQAPAEVPAWLETLRPWLVRVTAGQPASRTLLLALANRVALGQDLDGVAALPATPSTSAERRARRMRRELALYRATQTGPFDPLLADAAEQTGIDVFLFKGLLENESRLDPRLRSRKVVKVVEGKKRIVSGGATGIAQFTPGGVRGVNNIRRRKAGPGQPIELFTVAKANLPEKAIPAAAELLAHLIELFGRDGGVTAYNTGPVPGKAVARHGFYEARRLGLLCKVGSIQVQGERFLLNVLRRTNRLRAEVGLPPLDPPKDRRRTVAERTPLPDVPEVPSGG
jgi:soluble lytic murein transglycosylase-like protein